MKLLEKIKQFLSDNVFKRELLKTFKTHLSPETTLNLTDGEFFKSAFKTHLLFLILYIITNFLFSLFNLSYLVEYTDIMRGYLVEGKISTFMYLLNAFPYNIFVFVFSLIIFELYFSIGSYLTVKLFGEKNVSFLRAASLVISSNIYILLSLFPILLFFSFMPASAKRDIYNMILFIGFVSIFLIAGVILQMVSFIRISKYTYAQNSGRAFLTWFLPIFAIFFFFVWSIGPTE